MHATCEGTPWNCCGKSQAGQERLRYLALIWVFPWAGSKPEGASSWQTSWAHALSSSTAPFMEPCPRWSRISPGSSFRPWRFFACARQAALPRWMPMLRRPNSRASLTPPTNSRLWKHLPVPGITAPAAISHPAPLVMRPACLSPAAGWLVSELPHVAASLQRVSTDRGVVGCQPERNGVEDQRGYEGTQVPGNAG
jgi:hypothetical protein